jgi:thioredoxin reductase (NADPH)
MIETDICVIGAGPVGLFAVFEAGLLKMKCHLVDALPNPGGQLSEIYPKKPIYDIPGFPEVKAQELVDNLLKQGEPFKPTFTLGERVEQVEKMEDGTFLLETSRETRIHARAIVIAGGLGCFEPRKPALEEIGRFEGKGVEYIVRNPEDFEGKKLVIAGGGDSALDWTLYLAELASELTLVHRNHSFRGAPDSVEKVMQLRDKGKINVLLGANLKSLNGNGHLQEVGVENDQKQLELIKTEYLLPLFGLSPKLGPIADWNLDLSQNAIVVNTEDFQSSVPGIFAIGDINTYPGKLKLILSGFHEAALMAHGAYRYIYPDKKPSFKYTTVSGVNAL